MTEEAPLITKLGPLGKWANNLYLLVDPATRDALIIDAPEGAEEVFDVAKEANVKGILITHSHPDHTAGLDITREFFGAPVYCHPAEPWLDRAKVDEDLEDGRKIPFGQLDLTSVFTPGHTAGSTCFVVGRNLFSGDTLFPGGPGRTQSAANLRQEIESITSHLYVLDDGVTVYPGHGDNTTIGDSKREYAAFASREHDPDLHGDVLWAES
jgi:glyoxylase-like metal-dependent hydrolase (beta-lactamase superfamily II)